MSQRALSLGGPALMSVRRTRPDPISPINSPQPTDERHPTNTVRSAVLDRAILDLLPRRSALWQELVGRIRPDDVYFRVRESAFVEFADTGRLWSAISRSGEITHFTGSQPPSRTLLVRPETITALHVRQPLIEIMRDGVRQYRFARPGETPPSAIAPVAEAPAHNDIERLGEVGNG